MTTEADNGHCYRLLSSEALIRLRSIAAANREEFFAKEPRCLALRERVLCVALCQGAALHYVDSKNGIKDFDVWTFYAGLPGVEFPWRWRVEKDYGEPSYGQSPDRPAFIGRRVDLLGRSLAVAPDADPITALQEFFPQARLKPPDISHGKQWCCWNPPTYWVRSSGLLRLVEMSHDFSSINICSVAAASTVESNSPEDRNVLKGAKKNAHPKWLSEREKAGYL